MLRTEGKSLNRKKTFIDSENRYSLQNKFNSARWLANLYIKAILMLEMRELRQLNGPRKSTSLHSSLTHLYHFVFKAHLEIFEWIRMEPEEEESVTCEHEPYWWEKKKLCQPHSRKNHFICKFPMSSSFFLRLNVILVRGDFSRRNDFGPIGSDEFAFYF